MIYNNKDIVENSENFGEAILNFCLFYLDEPISMILFYIEKNGLFSSYFQQDQTPAFTEKIRQIWISIFSKMKIFIGVRV